MLRNYLTIAVRVLARNRLYTLLSASGLTVALAAALLVAVYAQQELRYDRFHDRAEDVVRLVTHAASATTERAVGFAPLALAPYLESEHPGVEHFARVWEYRRAMPVENPERNVIFYEEDFGWAERGFFDLFDFPITAGDAEAPLRDRNSVVISESAAARYFGDQNPIGKTISFRGEEPVSLQVTAVMRDFPVTSHLQFDFISTIEAAHDFVWAGGRADGWLDSWENLFVAAYLRLSPGADPAPIEADASEQVDSRLQPLTGSTYRVEMQPITDVHLGERLDVGGFEKGGSRRNLIAVVTVGLIVLLLGGFNFVNLATARAGQRAKEVGIRKTVGGTRRQLVVQHYLECAVLVGGAFVLGVGLAETVRPFLGATATLPRVTSLLADPVAAAATAGVLLAIVGLAGAYPALFLARFAPASVLKTGGSTAGGGAALRRVLVTTQFALSAALIICTGVIYQQLTFLQDTELGFAEEQIVVVPIHSDAAILPRFDRLKDAYLQQTGVTGVTASSHLMFATYTYHNNFRLEGRSDRAYRWERYTVEGDYPEVYGLRLVAGRPFRTGAAADTNAVLLNERAVRELGLTADAVLGRQLVNETMETSGEVVGVVADFHYQSLHEAIQPFVLVNRPQQIDFISVKIRPENVAQTVGALRDTWQAVIPDAAFGYSFLDDTFAAVYVQEERLTQILFSLSLIAVLLACLGLFGLSMHAAHRRTKEVGIRKILGASVWDLVRLLGRDFTILVGAAVLIAAPVAYGLMEAYLQTYAYRIDVPLVLFALAGAAVLLVAWATMSVQVLRVAAADPIDSLRSE